ncbi:MAG: M48 family metallopeptidase [Deltaproteobacteria bacterium]|nr:M48 family metallopeptidase [Deltaproteobacteria bacterium]
MIDINSFLLIFVIVYIFGSVADIFIDILNAYHLKKNGMTVPSAFSGLVDNAKLKKITSYTADNTRISVIKGLAGMVFFLAIILYGFLPWLSDQVAQLNYLFAGLVFFAVPGIITALIGLPFSYYSVFVIEEKYGFNTTDLKTWIIDNIKSLIISLVLGGVLLSLLLFMINSAGKLWWLWAWAVFLAFQLLMTIIYPTVIAPLFNKFFPIVDKELEKAIRDLAEKKGISVTGIFQMDAGKRSRHTNAYFSGLGKSKRIVLYDTLIETHDQDEILAVLAHEIGHLKKGHIKKQLILMSVISLILFYISAWMIDWDIMYKSFGFTATPFYAGLFLISILWGPVGFFVSPAFTALSRRYEREADRFARDAMGSPQPLIKALRQMAVDNLSNLCPHPLYVKFNYSHPPIAERIKNLESI